MKHNLKITIILLLMFIATQFIGIYVVNHYSKIKIIDGQMQNVSAPDLPLGLETPEVKENVEFAGMFVSLIIAFIIAVALLFLLTKFNVAFILKLWFFSVVIIALIISFNSFINTNYTIYIAGTLAIILAYIKIYQRNFFIHNLTELFIYPGIAAVFVPILNIYTIILLLIIISIYDMWAVWHSGIMQKMAKFQINHLNIFAGFFIPHAQKKERARIKKIKQDLKAGLITKKDIAKKKFKINIAILGGGDVVFPIIAAGVMLKTFGLLSAIFVVIGATLGLSYLFFFGEKKKFYPAMPFITAGIFLGMLAGKFF